MPVEIKREGIMPLFVQGRAPTGFLQNFFTFKNGNIYNGDKVFVDIQRFGEPVAIAIEKCTGPNMNDITRFTTKEFEPPAYGEAFPMDACELLNRMAGEDPYSAAYTSYAGQLVGMMLRGFIEVDAKIARAIELQAAQILQTGQLTLTDANGDTRYTIDFLPKATHFPTVSTNWSDPSADIDGDLASLADVISEDGKVDVNLAIMGRDAIKNFCNNTNVQAKLDNRRINVGEIRPQSRNAGATFYGFYWTGSYELEIWGYKSGYEDPQTGDFTRFIEDDKVILLSSETRLDKTSARVPQPVAPDPRVAGLLPGRLASRDGGFDVNPNVYASNNGKQIFGELESRPLLVPVQIDGFGCLDTEI